MFHTIRKVKKYRKLLKTGGVRKRKKLRGTVTKRDFIACENPEFLSKEQTRTRRLNKSVNVSGKRRRKMMKILSRQALPTRSTGSAPELMTSSQSKKQPQKSNKSKKKTGKKKTEPVDLSTPEDSEMEDEEMQMMMMIMMMIMMIKFKKR
ncbi:hypothetical protein LOTGIDRAFT_237396 [Lottia gigantea]|uniref:Uncharacterized protein n=1 Tax=Lottia gigantea TaxID=225164 RepID=V4BA91_LOTGI|nr:hypothetical protein LOTGIDRAFT_237396 [Lottia gigantea]ESP04361.1 hypothetical protein LOTGIDRAFT_237396 [Lottia gigantea]